MSQTSEFHFAQFFPIGFPVELIELAAPLWQIEPRFGNPIEVAHVYWHPYYLFDHSVYVISKVRDWQLEYRLAEISFLIRNRNGNWDLDENKHKYYTYYLPDVSITSENIHDQLDQILKRGLDFLENIRRHSDTRSDAMRIMLQFFDLT